MGEQLREAVRVQTGEAGEEAEVVHQRRQGDGGQRWARRPGMLLSEVWVAMCGEKSMPECSPLLHFF